MRIGIRSDLPADVNPASMRIDAIDANAAGQAPSLHGRALVFASKARSAANISNWLTYLPPDCVRSMVKMGWDMST